MDFPSRDEARVLIQQQAKSSNDDSSGAVALANGESGVPNGPSSSRDTGEFRIEKPGYQADVFDRRGIRNLIRTGDVLESDRVRVGDTVSVLAGSLPYLKSLFNLAREQRAKPPRCCRTHTDRVAFFQCHDSGRPLCEPCAPEKKFGGQTIRVCQHCGGTATDLVGP
jgi:hypothetical protein